MTDEKKKYELSINYKDGTTNAYWLDLTEKEVDTMYSRIIDSRAGNIFAFGFANDITVFICANWDAVKDITLSNEE